MSGEHVEVPHGTLRSYVTGYLLSLGLTAVPFVLVMASVLSVPVALIAVTVLALSQITVHLFMFLHLGRASEAQRWRVIIFAYALIILGILVGGSIWIMHHLDIYHMGR